MQLPFSTQVNPNRVRLLSKQDTVSHESQVIYWMSRDQRVYNNWALLFAQDIALETNSNLTVVFTLSLSFLGATLRQYDFMLKGLKEVEEELKKYNIALKVLIGNPSEEIVKYVKQNDIKVVVTDFSPLKISRKWKRSLVSKTQATVYEVDAHNIVPVWVTSDKQEYAARTIRPKIHSKLDEFLTSIPNIKKMPKANYTGAKKINWQKIEKQLKVDKTVKPILWLKPGEKAAQKVLQKFLTKKIKQYAEQRNDPSNNALSNLSPYIHFGQISAQQIALETKQYDAFFEELVVRRELAENYCFYNRQYDSFDGFPEWAQKTLNKHAQDTREHTYSQKELENAQTHDDAWNAAQLELLIKGKMHGYMRMYWAKKILEWTKDPQEALKTAIYLNDKYELDGRDPNGYTGIAWSIGGVHDRGWTERPIFGKIRYMNYKGLKRKFNIEKYIRKFIDK